MPYSYQREQFVVENVRERKLVFFVSFKIFETRVLLDRLRNHKANEARALEESAWEIAREKERRNERERERTIQKTHLRRPLPMTADDQDSLSNLEKSRCMNSGFCSGSLKVTLKKNMTSET